MNTNSDINETGKYGAQFAHKEALRAVCARRIGTLPGSIALKSADIGEAKLEDGSIVTITWGRNINLESQEWHLEKTDFKPIWVGADDGCCELIIPDHQAEKLKSVVI